MFFIFYVIILKMKTIVRRVAFRLAQDRIAPIVSPFVPPIVVQSVPSVIDYVVSNNFYIRSKKCTLLVHPKKIIKTIPALASADIIQSDSLNHLVDTIHDKNVHDFVHISITFVKYAMMAL